MNKKNIIITFFNSFHTTILISPSESFFELKKSKKEVKKTNKFKTLKLKIYLVRMFN